VPIWERVTKTLVPLYIGDCIVFFGKPCKYPISSCSRGATLVYVILADELLGAFFKTWINSNPKLQNF
jgi:hypothetical protein